MRRFIGSCQNESKASEAVGKGKTKSILKSIRQHKKTQKMFRKLQTALNPKKFGGLMSLCVPTVMDGGLALPPEISMDWEVVNDPVEVEQNIIEQSK